MAEQTKPNAAVETGNQPPAQPAHGDGTITLSRDEYEAMRRNADRVPGMQRFFEAANQHGFKDESSFEQAAQRLAQLEQFNSRTGLRLDSLLGSLDQDVASDEKPLSREDVLSMIEQERSKDRASSLWKDHQTGLTAQQEALKGLISDDLAKELLGENANDFMREGLRSMIETRAREAAGMYEDDSVLSGMQRPFGREQLDKALSQIRELRTKSQGAELDNAATQAANGTPATVAGGGAGQGKPETETHADDDGPDPMIERYATQMVGAGGAVSD